MESKLIIKLFFASIIIVIIGGCVQSERSTKESENLNYDVGIVTSNDKNIEENNDTNDGKSLSNEIRQFPIGKIQSITIKDRKFYDWLSNRVCRNAKPDDKITKNDVKFFIENAEPVSPVSLYNYYHSKGECFSGDVIVKFKDGRRVAVNFSDSGTTAYISPIVDGKKVDSFPHICRACDEDGLM